MQICLEGSKIPTAQPVLALRHIPQSTVNYKGVKML